MRSTFKLTSLFLLASVFASDAFVETGQINVIKRIIEKCENQTEVMKCFKIVALKFAERAMRAKSLELFTGVDIVQNLTQVSGSRVGRIMKSAPLREDNLIGMDNEKINSILMEYALDFLETHVVSINLPRLVDEARRRKKNRFAGPFFAALAIKGVLMSMAYKSIAIMAGTALIVGKMALVLAAILGLKKLVSGEKEKTTLEIIKHPTHSNTHTYSSSYEDTEGHYRRSMATAEDVMILDSLENNRY